MIIKRRRIIRPRIAILFLLNLFKTIINWLLDFFSSIFHPPSDTFGSTTAYKRSTARLTREKHAATKSTLPCTIGKSLCLIASIIRRPTPGMENTISVSIAPPRRVPNWRPTTVMIGINAFRNTCFTITTISF